MELRGNNEYQHLIIKLDESKNIYVDITKKVRYLKYAFNKWTISFIGDDNLARFKNYEIRAHDNPQKVAFDKTKVFFNYILRDDINDVLQFGELGYKVFFKNKNPKYVPAGKVRIGNDGRLDIITTDLRIKETNNNVFDYYKRLSKYASDISEKDESNDETSVEQLLYSLYEQVDSIRKNSVLQYYTGQSILENIPTLKYFIYPFSTNLSQINAVEQVFNNKLSVIAGPPGTGKTQVILNIIANAVKKGMHIAVISNNNTAVDNVYTKMKEEDLDFILAYLGNSSNVNKFFSNPDNLQDRLAKFNQKYDNENVNEIIELLRDLYEKNNDLVGLHHKLYEINEEFRHYKESHEYVDFEAQVPHYSSPEEYLKIKYYLLSLKKVKWCNRVCLRFKYKVKYDKKNILESFIDFLEHKNYECKIEKVEKEIQKLNEYINSQNYDALRSQLKTNSRNSLLYTLKAKYKKVLDNKQKYEFNKKNYKNKFEEFLERYPVILSTTQSLLRNIPYDFGDLFDLIVVDEASQSDIMTSLLSMNVSKRMVVVGDDKQLSQIDNKDIYEMSDKLVLKQHIKDCYNYKDNSILQSVLSLSPKVPCTVLKEHYRCDSRIIEFCNRKFYNNELIICTKTSSEDPLLIVHTVEGNHARHNTYGSGWYNEREADEILRIIEDNKGAEIGIITPFRAQVECVEKKIKTEYPDVEIDTIHKYQGRQKDIVILSTVVNDLNYEKDSFITDFVTNEKLLNVAISRAVKKLYLVVSDKVFKSQKNTIAKFIEYIEYYCSDSIQEGKVTSVFDELYKNNKTIIDNSRCKKLYDSEGEKIIFDLVSKKLNKYPNYKIVMHYRLSDLIKKYDGCSDEEIKYIKNPRTHVDFVIMDKLSFKPVFCIEVDGKYHDYQKQSKHDKIKDEILAKNGIELLRLKTNQSGEEEKISKYL